MSAASRLARPDRRVGAVDPRGCPPRDETLTLTLAVGLAVACHLAVLLLVRLPQREAPAPVAPPRSAPPRIVVWEPPLPPLPLPPPPATTAQTGARLPVPDPQPERPEPLLEETAPPPPHDEATAYELPELVPGPPPPPAPHVPGRGGVTHPELEHRVEPVYPELARRARLGGEVILQAVVRADGSVDEVRVLRCDRPGVGFEAAAIDAVQEWRYRPATLYGRPVDVYLTVHVTFAVR